MSNKMSGEGAFNKAVRSFVAARDYRSEYLDQNGLPSLVQYVRYITSSMPDVFSLELTSTGGIVVTAPDGKEFNIVPYETNDDDQWSLVLLRDDLGLRMKGLVPESWRDEDLLLERFFSWCQHHCPPEEYNALDKAEARAGDLIMDIRGAQLRSGIVPPAPNDAPDFP